MTWVYDAEVGARRRRAHCTGDHDSMAGAVSAPPARTHLTANTLAGTANGDPVRADPGFS